MILIVDDCADVAGAMQKLLLHRGFAVECIADAQSALAAMKARVPEMVILDHHMPGMSGLELFFRMKEEAKLKGVPVIFFSAEGKGDSQREAMKLGARDWVTKDGTGWKKILEAAEQVRGKSAERNYAGGESVGVA